MGNRTATAEQIRSAHTHGNMRHMLDWLDGRNLRSIDVRGTRHEIDNEEPVFSAYSYEPVPNTIICHMYRVRDTGRITVSVDGPSPLEALIKTWTEELPV